MGQNDMHMNSPSRNPKARDPSLIMSFIIGILAHPPRLAETYFKIVRIRIVVWDISDAILQFK